MRSKIAEKNANHLLQIVLFFHLFFDFLSIFFCFDSRAKKTLLPSALRNLNLSKSIGLDRDIFELSSEIDILFD